MYVVMTRVKLKPNTQDHCATLFEKTNPALVRDEPEWLGARMMFDPGTQVVTVLATWRDVDAYKHLSQSDAFQQTMKEFSTHFAGPPEISLNTLMVDMTPSSI